MRLTFVGGMFTREGLLGGSSVKGRSFCRRAFHLATVQMRTVQQQQERVADVAATLGSLCCGSFVWYSLRPKLIPAVLIAGVAFLWTWLVFRWVVFAGAYRRSLRKVQLLADDSSQFANVLGVEVHFKREDPSACKSIAPSGSVTGAVLFHGFGASLFSFQKIMAPLANLIHGPAIALDHPGFGLTVRPAVGFDQYSTAFGAKLGMKLAQREGLDEVVFVGHSMGAYVASLAALEDGNRSRALILIAPAVPPPGEFLNEVLKNRILRRLIFQIRLLWKTILIGLWYIVMPLFIPVLRAAVTTVSFWQWCLRFAVYRKDDITKETVEGYQLPNRAEGWDRGFLSFTWSQLGASKLEMDETAEHTSTYELISQRKIPTLVIHGANDAIVPVSTGRKVAACISSATFHEIPECGHLPHEEYPQKFVEIVAAFLQNLDDV